LRTRAARHHLTPDADMQARVFLRSMHSSQSIMRNSEWIRTVTWLVARIFAVMIGIGAVPVGVFAQQAGRFIEFDLGNHTDAFDLQTVKELQPGRFSIEAVSMRHPDLIRLELQALRTTSRYCSNPVGNYPAPGELFVLGKPDLPTPEIQVKNNRMGEKVIQWDYPYSRFIEAGGRPRRMVFRCWNKTELEEQNRLIADGLHIKQGFDCRRALGNWYFPDIPDQGFSEIRENTIEADEYVRVCTAVYHQKPHDPWPHAGR
jgi:hypothetical protein